MMTNKYCIITPTYIDHFKYVKNYLKSFIEYVEDRNEMPIAFIIGDEEKDKFRKIIKPFENKADILVYSFDDILKYFGIHDTSVSLLQKYGKFDFQTMKKLYGMLYLPYDKYLVLDSESTWIRKTNMHEVFNDYFKSPCIWFNKINRDEINDLMRNIDFSTEAVTGISQIYF